MYRFVFGQEIRDLSPKWVVPSRYITAYLICDWSCTYIGINLQCLKCALRR